MAAARRTPAPGLDVLPPPGLARPASPLAEHREALRLQLTALATRLEGLAAPPAEQPWASWLQQPTLLASRRTLCGADVDEGMRKATWAPKPLDGQPMYVRVHSPIETTAAPSALLDGFFKERQVQTCPGSLAGCLQNVLQGEWGPETCGASRPTSPGSDSTTSTEGPPRRAILSLTDSLSPRCGGGVVPFEDDDVAAGAKTSPPPPRAPAPGSEELPSLGSAGHDAGVCKPCAFFHKSGCQDGLACAFCHLCEPGEKKRRRKDKLQARRLAQRLRKAQREGMEYAW